MSQSRPGSPRCADIGVATLALLVGIAFILRGLGLCALAWAIRTARRELLAATRGGGAV